MSSVAGSTRLLRRRHRPSLSALQAFEAAARHGSFARAAEELSLTPGAVSRQIRSLEDMLGVRLFELVRRRVRLTQSGETYLADVQSALLDLDQATARMLTGQGRTQVLELATQPTFCSRWLIPRLPRFFAAHPHVAINFTTQLEPFAFSESRFDAAIHFGAPAWADAVLDHLFDERMVPVCSPSFREAHRVRTRADLTGVPLLQLASRPEAWADWFRRHGMPEAVALRGLSFDQFSMLAAAASSGLGAALVADFVIEADLSTGQLVALDEPRAQSNDAYYLVVAAGKTALPAVQAFRSWLLDEVGAHGRSEADPSSGVRRSSASRQSDTLPGEYA